MGAAQCGHGAAPHAAGADSGGLNRGRRAVRQPEDHGGSPATGGSGGRQDGRAVNGLGGHSGRASRAVTRRPPIRAMAPRWPTMSSRGSAWRRGRTRSGPAISPISPPTRVAVPGDRAGPGHPADCRVGAGRAHDAGPDGDGAGPGGGTASPPGGCLTPRGPRQPVGRLRLPGPVGARRPDRERESAGPRLGQRGYRVLAQPAEEGVGVSEPLPYPGRRPDRHLRSPSRSFTAGSVCTAP